MSGRLRYLVVDTGETGWVDPDQPKPRTFHLDDGTERVIQPYEIVRVLPPAWSISVDMLEER